LIWSAVSGDEALPAKVRILPAPVSLSISLPNRRIPIADVLSLNLGRLWSSSSQTLLSGRRRLFMKRWLLFVKLWRLG
jgi:hypothetical protein